MAGCFSLLLSFLIYKAQSKVQNVCGKQPVDLNTATLSELDALPFISSSSAQSIIDIRPICSPLELTSSPVKIEGLTQDRLNTNWNWHSDKSCDETCCLADATCNDGQPQHSSTTAYSWKLGTWDECTADCDTGTQYRDIQCTNTTHTVHNTFCALNSAEPKQKQLCNTHKCSTYRWVEDKWGTCTSVDDECVQTRSVHCYDTVYNTLSTETSCADTAKLSEIQSCDESRCRSRTEHKQNGKQHLSARIDTSSNIGDGITATVDLFTEYNAEKCYTDSYYDVEDSTLITRRGCSVDIEVYLEGGSSYDASTFYLDVTLDAETTESVTDVFTNNYLSWSFTDRSTAAVTIAIPSDGYIGKFDCHLYLSSTGVSSERVLIESFTLYVLFNAYLESEDTYVPAITERKEYIENTMGLLWLGSVDSNSAMKWDYDQFRYSNLDISMHLLRRLELEYRSDIVLIARQISYAVADDICYGRWSGDYTTGRPSGGYTCKPSSQNCFEPWTWDGTTAMFTLYESMDREYKVQYCQCWVFAAVSTTVGRALGIATRPITNFQSAHDTDYNRAIEKYFMYNSWSRSWRETDGDTSDSVWNFHAWNDMYFKRNDFTDSAYNVAGWHAVDATPQEASYGGNPSRGNYATYQMGPASLDQVKANDNPSECAWSSPNKDRFGCFDQEFVISEVNAYYNLWYRSSAKDPFKLYDSFTYSPWSGSESSRIGQSMSTKAPGDALSDDCKNEAIADCDTDRLDITLQYKDEEPSGAGEPTDKTNWYSPGEEKSRRRLMNTNTTDDVEFNEGVEYSVDLIPREWLQSLIIADDKDDIITLYADDYTYGRMSVSIDSLYDSTKYVYCLFTVNALDYRGSNFGNRTNATVKMDKMNFVLKAGEDGACAFTLAYSEYSSWMEGEDVPYQLEFAVSASLYDNEDDAASDVSMPSESILEQYNVLICVPKYKLSDRIICKNGLIWAEPSYNLTYSCDDMEGVHIEAVGDGFCDAVNNVDPCFDGGDCCATSCVPSDEHKCEAFDCSDDRVAYNNAPYYECPQTLSFIDYMNALLTDDICVDLDTSITKKKLECSDEIWDTSTATGNECWDYVNEARDIYGDVKTCLRSALNAIEPEMTEILEWAIDCYHETHGNGTDTTNAPGSTSKVTQSTAKDTEKKDEEKKNNTVTVVGIVASVVAVLLIGVVLYYLFVQKKQGPRGGDYDAPFMQMGSGDDNDGDDNNL